MKKKWAFRALVAAGICTMILPAAMAVYNVTGNYYISGQLAVGTDTPDPIPKAQVHKAGTGSARFRLSNGEGYAEFATDNAAFQIFANGSQRMTVWPTTSNGGKVTFGQFAGVNGTDVEVYGDLLARDMVRAQNTMSAAVVEIRGEGNDLVEGFFVHAPEAMQVLPGMVVSIDAGHLGQMKVSDQAYDRAVGGIISGAGDLHAGIKLGDIKEGEQQVALTGQVWCLVDGSFGAVTAGDSLTTSTTPGHAMKVSDYAQAQGATIGKAMSSLAAGEKGLVLVLVNLH